MLIFVRDRAIINALSFACLKLCLIRYVLLVSMMFLVGISPSSAEIISAHSEAAGDLLLSLMRRSPIKNPEALWARRDICQYKATVNRVYYDTNILITCMLGRTQKATTGEPGRRKKPSSEKKASPEKKVNVDPDPDWAGATRERILKGKQGEIVSVNDKRKLIAPYGSSDCAKISAKPNRGTIDWDFVIVRNSCSYPIKVLTCYFDVGHESDCVPNSTSVRWGLTGIIEPGGSVDSVATSKAWPWAAKKIVCDMRERSDLLCVLPK